MARGHHRKSPRGGQESTPAHRDPTDGLSADGPDVGEVGPGQAEWARSSRRLSTPTTAPTAASAGTGTRGRARRRSGRSAAPRHGDRGQQLDRVVVTRRTGCRRRRLGHRAVDLKGVAAGAAAELVPGHRNRVMVSPTGNAAWVILDGWWSGRTNRTLRRCAPPYRLRQRRRRRRRRPRAPWPAPAPRRTPRPSLLPRPNRRRPPTRLPVRRPLTPPQPPPRRMPRELPPRRAPYVCFLAPSGPRPQRSARCGPGRPGRPAG